MHAQHHQTALSAATVALSSRRSRATRGLASIELRATDEHTDRWELLASAVVALFALGVVVAAWLF